MSDFRTRLPSGNEASQANTIVDGLNPDRPATGILADPGRRLRLLLSLVAVHSAVVGLGLIWQPAGLFARLGYTPVGEPFFPVQGGVFHIVMAIGYLLASRDLVGNRCLTAFAIVVKAAATLFLLTYWLVANRLTVVLLSGIGDGVMAVLLRIGYVTWRRDSARGEVK